MVDHQELARIVREANEAPGPLRHRVIGPDWPGWPGAAAVAATPDEATPVDIELGEVAEAVARREKLGELVLGDKTRAALVARVERAQAARGARLVRAAGEAVPNAPAPAVGPDMVWSGDYEVLLSLFKIGLYRVSMAAAYAQDLLGRHCAPLGVLGRAHGQP